MDYKKIIYSSISSLGVYIGLKYFQDKDNKFKLDLSFDGSDEASEDYSYDSSVSLKIKEDACEIALKEYKEDRLFKQSLFTDFNPFDPLDYDKIKEVANTTGIEYRINNKSKELSDLISSNKDYEKFIIKSYKDCYTKYWIESLTSKDGELEGNLDASDHYKRGGASRDIQFNQYNVPASSLPLSYVDSYVKAMNDFYVSKEVARIRPFSPSSLVSYVPRKAGPTLVYYVPFYAKEYGKPDFQVNEVDTNYKYFNNRQLGLVEKK